MSGALKARITRKIAYELLFAIGADGPFGGDQAAALLGATNNGQINCARLFAAAWFMETRDVVEPRTNA